METNELIKKRRKELGLTLEQVGNYVGVGKSTVRKWETGLIENIRRDKIVLLAEILKVSPLDLVWDKSDDEALNIGERFKYSREELGLTQSDVGKTIGISTDEVNDMEIGKLKNSEENYILYKRYCQEYGVSYLWLTKGVGKPMLNYPKMLIDELATTYKLDDDLKAILKKIIELTPSEREVIKKLFNLSIEQTKKDEE